MDDPRTAPDRDPRSDSDEPQKEGGVKTAEGGPPSPDSPITPGGVEGDSKPEREADPSLSIESVNGDRADEREGGMIGEGGH